MNPLEERAVVPFYLEMMGLNAPANVSALWDALVVAANALTITDAKWLLNVGAWRPVVMGAWFSTQFPAGHIGSELKRAMGTSQGSLTAPPLAAACAAVVGMDALPAMGEYVETDPGRDGSTRVVAAGIEHLGGSPTVAPRDEDRKAFQDLLHVAVRLRSGVV
jgi:hypothetical protein